MPDEIQPALIPSEFRDRKAFNPGSETYAFVDGDQYPHTVLHFVVTGMTLGPLSLAELRRLDVAASWHDFHALMALANAALPDGDPRKITRADVDFLLSWAEELSPSWTLSTLQKDEPVFRTLAAKLAALLPPTP